MLISGVEKRREEEISKRGKTMSLAVNPLSPWEMISRRRLSFRVNKLYKNSICETRVVNGEATCSPLHHKAPDSSSSQA